MRTSYSKGDAGVSYEDRKRLIAQLEQKRGSKILCYILSDRESFPPNIPGFSAQLASEPQLFFVDHLRAIGKAPQLDVFLYTRGGATDSVWPLISLLREHADRLTVLVPFRAHSGGTLLCLGADEVIMSEAAELSPIDPTTGNQFNPTDPANPANRFGISVEDVAAYFQLSKDRAGITEQQYQVDVLKELTRTVHPLALGNVQRVYLQIRRLASELLSLHMEENDPKIDQIIAALTEKFYSHVHAINRHEAITLMGDWVRSATEDESINMWELFNSYADTLSLRNKYHLPTFMGDEPVRDLTVLGGFIESTDRSYIYNTTLQVIQRPNVPPNVQIQIPPGAPVPLFPGFSRSYSFHIQQMSWVENQQGV
jgi:hypothetical protein